MRRALSPRLFRTLLPPAFLLALTLALFWEVLCGGRRLYWGDLGLYFVPLLSLQRETLTGGHFALWNPTILCGTPLWGNPQAFPLYPSSLLLFVMPAYQVVGVIAAFHGWLASYGTFLFLRGRGLTTGASLLAAIVWGMGGAVVSKAQFPNMIQATAFLPWLLLCVDGAATRPRPLAAAKLGLTVGLALLAAHPQMFLMQFYLCAAWTVFRMQSGKRKNHRVVILCVGAGLVLGTGLAAGQLLPCVELVRDSVRTHLTLPQASRFVLPAYALLTNFVLPNFYGNPATSTEYVGRGNFWEPCAYLGIFPFVFALWVSVRLFRANREVRFWVSVAVLGVWLALGKDGGLWSAAFFILPGVSKFHDAARWLHVGTFALACLAGWGSDTFLRARPVPAWRRIWTVVLILGTAFDVIAFCRTLNPTTSASVWNAAINPQKGTPQKTRAFFADESRAWAHWVSYRTYRTTQTDTDVLAFLMSRTPNTGGLIGEWEVGGYEPVRRANSDALISRIKKQALVGKEGGVMEDVGISNVVRLGPHFAPQSRPIWGALGRAVFYGAGANPLPLRVVDDSPQQVVVWLPKDGHKPGMVVLRDTLHPGWTARIDNKPTPIDLANGVFRAVRVGKNDKQVDFRYEPASVRIGVFISLGALGILTAITFGETHRRRRQVAATQ